MISLSLSLLRSICCVSDFRYSNYPLQRRKRRRRGGGGGGIL